MSQFYSFGYEIENIICIFTFFLQKIKIMSLSKSRYEYQLNLFRTALMESISIHKSDQKKIPGITLYEKNARTPLFQLQGLARIDSKISRHKDLGAEWLDQFKKIEDGYIYFKN